MPPVPIRTIGWSLEFGAAIAVIPDGSGAVINELGRHKLADLRDGEADTISYEPLSVPPECDENLDVVCEVEWVSPTTSGDAVLKLKFGRISPTEDLTSETFGAELKQAETVSAAANSIKRSTFTLSYTEFGAVAGESCYPFVTRLGSDVSDTLAGVVRIRAVRVKQA